MKKPARGGAGGRGDTGRIARTKLLDLHPAFGTAPTHIELVETLAAEVERLQIVYGAVPFLTPSACASCGGALPPGPREAFGLGVMNAAPLIFFLCRSCFGAGRNGSSRVDDRIHERIDAAAALLDQLSRNTEA